MIGAIRYILSFILYMGWHGSRVVLAALAGVKQRTGGVYDDAARKWARGMLRGTGITVRVEGRERLGDGSRPVVYAANHASFIDIWALLAELPGSVRFVYKSGMNWIPLMGLAMRKARHIPIRRQSHAKAFAAYDEAARFIRGEAGASSASAIVFPEGTRSRTGRLQPLKKGPFVLATAAQVPIVPVYCEGTHALMPRGSISPKPGTVTLRIGGPISTEGLDYESRDELARKTREALLALGAVEEAAKSPARG